MNALVPPKNLARRPLSEVDKRLLDILERDSRKPVVALAKAVGLSRTAVQARLNRMEDDGDIAQYTIVRGGPQQSKLSAIFLLKATSRDRLIAKLKSHYEVKAIKAATGAGFDFVVCVEAERPEQIAAFKTVIEAMDNVSEAETAIILETCFDRQHAPSHPTYLTEAA